MWLFGFIIFGFLYLIKGFMAFLGIAVLEFANAGVGDCGLSVGCCVTYACLGYGYVWS